MFYKQYDVPCNFIIVGDLVHLKRAEFEKLLVNHNRIEDTTTWATKKANAEEEVVGAFDTNQVDIATQTRLLRQGFVPVTGDVRAGIAFRNNSK